MGPLEGTRALVGAAAHTPKPTCGESKRDQRRNFVRWSACIHSFAVMREQASRRAMAGPLRWSRRCVSLTRKADAAQGTIRDRSECNALGAADHSTGDRPSVASDDPALRCHCRRPNLVRAAPPIQYDFRKEQEVDRLRMVCSRRRCDSEGQITRAYG